MNAPTTLNAQAPVYLLDDDPEVAGVLAAMLKDAGLVARAFTTPAALFAAVASERPGCIVLDVCMPGMSGLEVQSGLRERGVSTPVVVLTGHADVQVAVQAMRAGATDFLQKPCTGDVLRATVERALARDARCRERQARDDAFRAAFQALSRRERDVLEVVLEGLTSRAIADRLSLCEGTVENHRTRIMRKLGVNCVAQLVRRVVECQCTAPDLVH